MVLGKNNALNDRAPSAGGATREQVLRQLHRLAQTRDGDLGMASQACVSGVEQLHHVDDVIVKLHQSWQDRLDFPPTKLPERYVRNQVAVGLELHSEQCFFLAGHRVYSVLVQHVRDVAGNHASASSEAEHELSVFVGNVHLVQNEKRTIERVGGVVRLKPVDQIADSGVRDSLYFSFVSGNTVFVGWPNFNNREFDSPRKISPVSLVRELPNDMIQTGSQVVNDLPREHAKPERDRAIIVIGDSLKKNLSIVLWNDGVFASLKKGIDFRLKITDVLVGPC